MRRDINKTQQEELANVTVLGRVWGYTIGYALTFPLGIIHTSLCLRPGTSPLVGLMPWSPLGRQHWVALPAKIAERLLVTLCTYVRRHAHPWLPTMTMTRWWSSQQTTNNKQQTTNNATTNEQGLGQRVVWKAAGP
jgi:hypothetical protein